MLTSKWQTFSGLYAFHDAQTTENRLTAHLLAKTLLDDTRNLKMCLFTQFILKKFLQWNENTIKLFRFQRKQKSFNNLKRLNFVTRKLTKLWNKQDYLKISYIIMAHFKEMHCHFQICGNQN